MEVGLSPGDFVLDGDPAAPTPKKESEPGGRAPSQFSALVYCGQTAGWIKMALGVEVGLGPMHIVLDGDTAHLPEKGAEPPIFGPSLLWPNGWMHMPLGMEVGLSPGNFVLDGEPAPYPKRGGAPAPTIFGPRLLWPNGCMDQDATGYGGRPRARPTRHCVRY